jgi:hypothetical protein
VIQTHAHVLGTWENRDDVRRDLRVMSQADLCSCPVFIVAESTGPRIPDLITMPSDPIRARPSSGLDPK